MRVTFLYRFSIFFVFLIGQFFCCAPGHGENSSLAGEIFNTPVSLEEYYFARNVVSMFTAQWRPTPKTQEELQGLVWQELIFRYEAKRRGIVPTQEEIDREITKTLKAEKVSFDWEKDQGVYAQWTQKKLGVTPSAFEKQMRHLVTLEKLRQEVLNSFKPSVSEKEAYQKFLDEYNTLSVELTQFQELGEAKKFYSLLRRKPQKWEKRKEAYPDTFQRPGFVALDFLINIWGFRRADAYKMITLKPGKFYRPSPVYKGYAVFKILKVRRADPEEFKKRATYYFNRVRRIKQYAAYKEWVKEIKKEANVTSFLNLRLYQKSHKNHLTEEGF